MNRRIIVILTLAALAAPWTLAAAEPESPASTSAVAPETEAYKRMLEDAERARMEAEAARREAELVAERARETARLHAEHQQEAAERVAADAEQVARERLRRKEDMERAREELSRTHRELREASREVARAHRELARAEQERVLRLPHPADRAVIGVVLGGSAANGVELIGVSPGGPAEAAGIQAGDVIVEIAGEDLSTEPRSARHRLFDVMYGVEAGDQVPIVVERDGEKRSYTVTAEIREPSSWQYIIDVPEIADIDLSGVPGEAEIIVEQIRVPELDHEALQEKMQDLQDRLKNQDFVFVDPDGKRHAWHGDFDFDFDAYSGFADQAFADADVFFGLSTARGLEFATVNEELGAYFKTERGVLVLRAAADNAYGLHAGDVILAVGGEEVDTPSELLRALRRAEPGQDVQLEIKRERRTRTLDVTMPENRLGQR